MRGLTAKFSCEFLTLGLSAKFGIETLIDKGLFYCMDRLLNICVASELGMTSKTYQQLVGRFVSLYGYDEEDNSHHYTHLLRSDGTVIRPETEEFAERCSSVSEPSSTYRDIRVAFTWPTNFPEEQLGVGCELGGVPDSIESRLAFDWGSLYMGTILVEVNCYSSIFACRRQEFHEKWAVFFGVKLEEEGYVSYKYDPTFSWEPHTHYRSDEFDAGPPPEIFGEYLRDFADFYRALEDAFLATCGIVEGKVVDGSINATALWDINYLEGHPMGPASAMVFHRNPQNFASDWARSHFRFQDKIRRSRMQVDKNLKLNEIVSVESIASLSAEELEAALMSPNMIIPDEAEMPLFPGYADMIPIGDAIKLLKLPLDAVDTILEDYCADPSKPKYRKFPDGSAALIYPPEESLRETYLHLRDEGLRWLNAV